MRPGQAAVLARLRREQAVRRRLPVDERLRRLLEHARTRSPHYRRVLAGLEGAPLEALPVLTKDDLVARFDELVTDPGLRRADLEAGAVPRRYRVAVSSGSSGRPGLVAFDPQEWAGLLAASASMRVVAGRAPGPRAVKIGSPSARHLSAQLGATLQDPRRPTLRLPATMPLDELVAAVDAFRPDILTAYPSVLGLVAGRLSVAPGQVFAGGEVLSTAVRQRVVEAWGSEPFDQYVTTEAGPLAGECPAHDGMHVIDDHVIVEVVDDAVLVTVLSSRTVPLVRYQLNDRVRLAEGPCACGRTGLRIASIDGLPREMVPVDGVLLHPTAFTAVLDALPITGWQVLHGDGRVRVLVVGPRAGFDAEVVQRQLPGAPDVEVVDALRIAGSGKASRFVDVSDGGR